MKKLMKLAAALLLVMAFANTSNAQFGVGLDIALPFEDGAAFGYGLSAGYEHKLSDNMGVGGGIGFLMFSLDEPDGGFFDDYSSSLTNIPILGMFKYYFTDNEAGLYGRAELGMTMYKYSVSYTYETITGFDSNFNPVYGTEEFDISSSEIYLTYGFGAGYLVNENIDISASFRIVSADGGSFNYLNIGARYNF